jgi:murein DD-endopeptidase MepM/ murein hydrolase activator NlpD
VPRLLTLLCALFLALLAAPPAGAVLLDPAPSPPAPQGPQAPKVVHPVAGGVDYGEHAARFGGPRAGRSHAGQDLFAPAGRPVRAVRDGRVLETGSGDARGNYVVLYSRDVRETYVYFHLLRAPRVKAGDRVRAGRRLGAVGCTGSCWGDHLHFEVRRGRGAGGPAVDPLPKLRRWASD